MKKRYCSPALWDVFGDNMNTEPNWAHAAQQLQETFNESLRKAFSAIGAPAPVREMSEAAQHALAPFTNGLPDVRFDAGKLQALQQRCIEDVSAIWNRCLQVAPDTLIHGDRRFSAEAWNANPLAKFSAAAYMLNTRMLMGLVDAVEGDAKTRARLRFGVEQWAAASAPSNFLALNAEALQKAIATQGESIGKGLQNLMHDIRQGHVSMTDESVFEVGKNVATTEGAVVFENEFFQLLEYKPLTAKVYEKPFLFVPPCINKYYILDLQPENSLIRHAVSEGHRTFVDPVSRYWPTMTGAPNWLVI